MHQVHNFWSRLTVLLVVLGLLVSACTRVQPEKPTPVQTEPAVEATLPEPTTSVIEPTDIETPVSVEPTRPPYTPAGPVFARFEEPAVSIGPAIPVEAAAPDLSNVQNTFVLSDEQINRLAENGFVVSPGTDKEFFTVYEQARYNNQPIFVTSDSLLHVYHLLFDKTLRSAEVQYFIPLLRDLNAAMLAQVDQQYQELKGTPWEDAARRTVAFVAVASKLLDPNVKIPDYAVDLVDAEIALIEAADGMLPSPIFPGYENGEDYTQYIPRGHYTLSEDLKAYFKSMMWYGRMTFRLKSRDPEVGRAETRSALLLIRALQNSQVNGRPALEAWGDLYSPTAFFVGRSDDLTVQQYLPVMEAVYGADAPLDLLTDEARLTEFIDQAEQLPPPRILGMVIMDSDVEEEVTKGLRFMGQRFVPDAYIFRQLMYRNVGTQQNRRGLPKGLDLFAAMGSERAYQILDEVGETQYENYPQQMDKMRQWLSGLAIEEWTETLYNTWLYSFFPLIQVPSEVYPAFMQSPAWVDKQLNTVLGSWSELKHDTILYAKQAYAELGGGPPPPPPLPPKGYVEPVPEFYARLLALTRMTREGLAARGLLGEQDAQSLEQLESMVEEFQLMAEKELRGEPLTDEEYETIRYYGGELEHLTMAAADTPDTEDPNAPKFLEEDPQAAVIADVATDPGPTGMEPVVLEEAVGRVNPIYVVVPIVLADGTSYLQVAKGGVFSQYEFVWPANDRLTDEKWRTMLDEGQAPELADWMDSFYVGSGEFSNLTEAIFRMQQTITDGYWSVGYGGTYVNPQLDQFQSELQALQAAKQYIGHQLVRSEFRSFDQQAEHKAVVTVRETWQDKLYSFTGDYANFDEPAIGERGPYPLDVTYTVEFLDGYWQVTNAVYANQPPDW